MSSTFKSIPYSATDTATASVLRFALTETGGCKNHTITDTVTETVSVVETDPTEYSPIVENSWRSAPTDGEWSLIKESGQIKMTPMSVGKSKVQNFIGSASKDKHQIAIVLAACHGDPFCSRNELRYGYDSASINYVEQGDLTYWRTQFPTAPFFKIKSDFKDARWERIKSEAYQNLFQAYNLGEELYELKETIMTLASLIRRVYNLLVNFKMVLQQIERLSSSEKSREVSKAWLEFRYGIMPIVYSIQDLFKLHSDSEGKYRTIRRTYEPTFSLDGVLPTSGNYFYEVGSESTIYRVTVKGRWASSAAKVADLININPLTTALAVFKYSLVVRWFINLNSVVDSWVKSFTSSALEYNGVTSIRIKRDISVYFHHEYDSRVSYYFNGDSVCGIGFFPPVGPFNLGNLSRYEILLQTNEENSYERKLFLPTDTKFVWDPNLSLSRLLDSLAMIFVRFSRL